MYELSKTLQQGQILLEQPDEKILGYTAWLSLANLDLFDFDAGAFFALFEWAGYAPTACKPTVAARRAVTSWVKNEAFYGRIPPYGEKGMPYYSGSTTGRSYIRAVASELHKCVRYLVVVEKIDLATLATEANTIACVTFNTATKTFSYTTDPLTYTPDPNQGPALSIAKDYQVEERRVDRAMLRECLEQLIVSQLGGQKVDQGCPVFFIPRSSLKQLKRLSRLCELLNDRSDVTFTYLVIPDIAANRGQALQGIIAALKHDVGSLTTELGANEWKLHPTLVGHYMTRIKAIKTRADGFSYLVEDELHAAGQQLDQLVERLAERL